MVSTSIGLGTTVAALQICSHTVYVLSICINHWNVNDLALWPMDLIRH